MSSLLREAAGAVQLGWVLGAMTLLFILTFVAWTWWAYAPSRRERMQAYGRMPLEDDSPLDVSETT